MSFPRNIIIVRHGMSEHNLARIRSTKGDDSDWDTNYANKHTYKYRLTDIGIEQSQRCGEFIRENICENFDCYFTSEYIRTVETSYYLNFKDADWQIDFTIRERDKGLFSGITEKQKKLYKSELKRKNKDEFYWSPIGGESVAELCQRVDHFIDFLKRECSDMNVIIVTHGTIMEAFRIRLENMTHSDYNHLKKQKIRNCQVLWYSRQHPKTREISNGNLEWFTTICPYDHQNELIWFPIMNKKYSNQDLYHRFSNVERYVNNTNEERDKFCSQKNGCEKFTS